MIAIWISCEKYPLKDYISSSSNVTDRESMIDLKQKFKSPKLSIDPIKRNYMTHFK